MLQRRSSLVAMAAALGCIVAAAIGVGPLYPEFMPHRACLDSLRHPWLLWMTVAAHLMVASAYYVMPGLLILAAIRGFAPAPGMFYLFGAFILACGTTHVFAAWTFWEPVYVMEAAVLMVTGCISWITVGAILREGYRARHAMVIVGRKLREAAVELREGDPAESAAATAEALELLGAHLERLQTAGSA